MNFATVSRRWEWAAIPVVAALLAHYSSFNNPFVFDDFVTLVDNPSLKAPLNWAFVWVFQPFRPLANVANAFIQMASGTKPQGFHLVAIVLHAANSGLLFLLARVLLNRERALESSAVSVWVGALCSSVLFAVHPLLTSTVGYISQLSEVFCLFFMLVGLLCVLWSEQATKVRSVAAGLSFLIAALFKEVGALAPFVLLLIQGRQSLRRYWPWLVLVTFAAISRVLIMLLRETQTLPRSIGENVLMQAEIIWRYLAMLAIPTGQSLVHEIVFRPVFQSVCLAALAAAAAALWVLRKRFLIETFGVATFFVLMIPTSSVVPLMEPMAEHRVYIASIGVFLTLGTLAARLYIATESTNRRVAAMVAGAIAFWALVLTVLSARRYDVWRDPVRLWGEAAAAAPGVWAPHYALGDALRTSGRCPEAMPAYEHALRIRPNDDRSRVNLGICYAQAGRIDDAETQFTLAVSSRPENTFALNNLARVALQKRDIAKAKSFALRVLQVDPTNRAALDLLGKLK